MWSALLFIVVWTLGAAPSPREIPDVLRSWETWATWNDAHRECPTPYSDPKTHRCFWPSRLNLEAARAGGRFDLGVTVFGTCWVPLPGGPGQWPAAVRSNGVPIPVIERGGQPSVRLDPGRVQLEGTLPWNEIPQSLQLPPEIGILNLILDDRRVEAPMWDAGGMLWLKRDALAESGERNFVSVKLYTLLEDGIPLWLRQEVELMVSGQSREEDLGGVLPEGWKLAAVESGLPVSVDVSGRMRVQVRPGKWTIRTESFRLDDPRALRYAPETPPAVAEGLLAFRARPDFRVLEIVGPPAVDASQTAMPDSWRQLPIFRWSTAAAVQLEQRLRGMGDQSPAGLNILREWWLDETGGGLTFRDRITGSLQERWRLDVAPGGDLGSVLSGGQGQLITRNPQNGAAGVELRTRGLDLEAAGRMARSRDLPATGWQADADRLDIVLNLPPGWRLFALWGADRVRGDWLTAWSLLDLFLLLVFTLAIFRLWGVWPAVLAFLAFGLSYHEPGSPRYLWLALLIPLALRDRVPAGRARQAVTAGLWIAVSALMLGLVPFLASQVQQALYPQLEPVARAHGSASGWFPAKSKGGGDDGSVLARRYGEIPERAPAATSQIPEAENLRQDARARIQTGPGVPEWSWRVVEFGWNGPVQASQRVRPILIPVGLERVLTVLRVVLLLGLATVLLRSRGRSAARPPTIKPAIAVVALLWIVTAPGIARAQDAGRVERGPVDATPAPILTLIPDSATLGLLRERLLEPSDAFPNAADIPWATLSLDGGRLVLEVEVHAAVRTAVPLPGRLPAWSPLKVTVNESQAVALRRDDGFLWVVVPGGIHRVRVEGQLGTASDWEWSFLLRPRRVAITAPDWTFSGVRPDGVPDAQVFFSPRQRSALSEATYERQELQPIVSVNRRLELGLVWQVRTVVTRLSPPGKAVSVRVPLLPDENVYSPGAVVMDGQIEVRLGAQETSFQWEGGLTPTNRLSMVTRGDDTWVERWELVASPVWNIALNGLAPLFESSSMELVPVWRPWPGEAVTLEISRPAAIAGATVTVDRALHELTLGRRQRVSRLDLVLRSSLAEDFPVELPPGAEITALTQSGGAIPARVDGGRLVIPLRPGEQTLSIAWKVNQLLGWRAGAGEVRLSVESVNVDTVIVVPDDRWVLWTAGPQRGPAVRFWVLLIAALLAAMALGRAAHSPLRSWAWILLVIGLTQVPTPAAMAVIAWLFFLAWRGLPAFQRLPDAGYNLLQVMLVLMTVVAMGILLAAVSGGLLGSPEMFITGNGSSRNTLRWFQDRSGPLLPRPQVWSLSIWWYRLLMLAWALWLAASLVSWLQLGWRHFGTGGFFRRGRPAPAAPPPFAPSA